MLRVRTGSSKLTPVFDKLCICMRAKIGEEKFKSEVCLEKNAINIPTFEAMQYTGGFIPGEIKVAAGLRMMAGGSYLDIGPLFCIIGNWVHEVFRDVFPYRRGRRG